MTALWGDQEPLERGKYPKGYMNTEIYISSSAVPPLLLPDAGKTPEQPEPNFSLMAEGS